MFSSEEALEKELQSTISQTKEALYKKFLDNNKKYIGYLVKEFELRRNAKQYARASISKTGKLDMKKIHQYKLNDDLFKRMTTVPKGKSHGLVMFIDYSGSMNDNIKATIEQTIVLAVFCRKVNIPFRVYSFTDATNTDFYEDSGVVYGDVRDYELRGKGIDKFSRREDDLIVDDTYFRLREYLSSEMTGNEFKEAIKFWLTSGYCFNKHWRGRMYSSDDKLAENSIKLVNSESETLNGTPLNEAIISAIDITRNFRKQYRLDVVNTVFLTDGDSNEYGTKYGADGKTTYLDKYNNDFNLIVRHTETMCEGKKPPRADTTLALLELLKQVSNVNVIGYFISSYFGRGTILNRLRRLAKWENDFEAKYKKARQTKFYMINDAGYDDFYFIPGGKELEIDKDEMEVETGARKNQIKSAFMKMQKNKVINRVLLSRFVSKIA
jgi:Mg-chelatase subunit ChlD